MGTPPPGATAATTVYASYPLQVFAGPVAAAATIADEAGDVLMPLVRPPLSRTLSQQQLSSHSSDSSRDDVDDVLSRLHMSSMSMGDIMNTSADRVRSCSLSLSLYQAA